MRRLLVFHSFLFLFFFRISLLFKVSTSAQLRRQHVTNIRVVRGGQVQGERIGCHLLQQLQRWAAGSDSFLACVINTQGLPSNLQPQQLVCDDCFLLSGVKKLPISSCRV